MIKQILPISLNAIILIIIFGCSGNNSNPISPQDSIPILDQSIIQVNPNVTDRIILGAGSFDLNPNIGTIVINPNRNLAGWQQNHLNVKPFLPAPTAQLISYNPVLNIYDVDVTINNNSIYDGYDVRLIIHTTVRGILLVNDDNWTPLWDAVGGSLINPFKAYAKLGPNRKFAAHTSHTERLQLYLPSGWDSVSFAIDASAGGNCVEPYKISNFTQGPLYQFIDSSTIVEVEVFDWQDNADVVALYCPVITGGIWESFSQVSSYKWQLNLVNRTAAPEGEYSGLLKATSSNLGSLVLYDFITISITQGTPTTDWTFLIYMNVRNDMQGYDRQTINDLEEAGSKEGSLNVIVLWDKYSLTEDDAILNISRDPNGYNDEIISPELAHPDWVFPDGGLVMKEQETLELFLQWSLKHFPAKKYALIFWGHGDGPFGDFDKYVTEGLSVWEIRDACQKSLIENQYFDKFSIIGFDCCLMGWIETAYCLKNVCQTGIASEIMEPSDGWEYHPTLEYIRNNSSICNTEDICKQIVNDYISGFTLQQKTLAAWRSDKLIDYVIPALNNFSDELTNALPSYRDDIESIWESSGYWGGTPGDNCSQHHVKDLGVFSKQIYAYTSLPETLRNAAQSLKYSIDNAEDDDAIIIHDFAVDDEMICPTQETGWQIWFPNDYRNYNMWHYNWSDYTKLGFSDTNWDEFLNAFDDITP